MNLHDLLDALDEQQLSTLGAKLPLSRPKAIAMLVERAAKEEAVFSESETAILTALLLVPDVGQKRLFDALSLRYSRTQLLSSLSSLEKRLFVLPQGNQLVIQPERADELSKQCSLASLITPGDALPDGVRFDGMGVAACLSLSPSLKHCPFPSVDEERWGVMRKDIKDYLSFIGAVRDDGSLRRLRSQELVDAAPGRIFARFLAWKAQVPSEAALRFVTILGHCPRPDKRSLKILLLLAGLGASVSETMAVWGVPRPQPEGGTCKARLDNDGSLLVEGPMGEGSTFWRFSDCLSVEDVSRWNIDEKSLRKGFDGGMEPEDIARALEELNVPSAPLEETISLAYERWSAVRLSRGIVLTADERVSRIIDSLPGLEDLVVDHPAEGVYVMDEENSPLWRSKLEHAIGDLPAIRMPKRVEAVPSFDKMAPVSWTDIPSGPKSYGPEVMDGNEEGSVEGFNYPGKVALVKESLKRNDSYLLIDQGTDDAVLVKPLSMSKGRDGRMVLSCRIPGEDAERNLPIGSLWKITLTRFPLL